MNEPNENLRPPVLNDRHEALIRATVCKALGIFPHTKSLPVHPLLDFNSPSMFVFPEGSLSHIISHHVPTKKILSSKEEIEIKESKEILEKLTTELILKKQLYYNMLKDPTTLVILQRNADNSKFQAKSEDIRDICIRLQKKILEYIKFLDNKASELIRNADYMRAEIEFKIALDYSIKTHGPNHIETLKIQLNYAIAQASYSNFEAGHALLEKTTHLLESEQLTSSSREDIKKPLAIATYRLAQHYFKKNNFELAIQLLDRSEKLRKEYNASAEELDRISFLRSKILYKNGNKIEGLELLTSCYAYRRSLDNMHSSLIPVLDELGNIMHEQFRRDEEVMCLSHLADIQKHLQFDDRQIIKTQLRLLRAMSYKTSEAEYWKVMEEIERRLNSIPVTQESFDVGTGYSELAHTRLSSLLPQSWSNIRKREYCSQTLNLIAKAELHLKEAAKKDNQLMTHLTGLKEKCLLLIDGFSNPIQVEGIPLHPEDAAALTPAILPNDTASTPDTYEQLKHLSEFSSEIRHSLLDPLEQILTPEEFSSLPENGMINPYRLRAAQGGINPEFRDGKSLDGMRQLLIKDPSYTNKIPPIEIGIYKNKVYSFDTRRLIVHQQAKEINSNVIIRYKKISGEYLQQRVEDIFSPRPWNGLVTALRYGGKGSPSSPYINPSVRTQLETKVDNTFKPYPNNRKGADPNGFPVLQQQAKKIHGFLVARAKNGSEFAQNALRNAKKISGSEGEEALYNFLIGVKQESHNQNLDKKSKALLPSAATVAAPEIDTQNDSEHYEQTEYQMLADQVFEELIANIEDKDNQLLLQNKKDEIIDYILSIIIEESLADSSLSQSFTTESTQLPHLIFTENNFIPIEPLVYLLQKHVKAIQKETSVEIQAVKLDDINQWLEDKVEQTEVNVMTMIVEKIAHLNNGHMLLIPVNIHNEHFTLLAILRNSNGNLISVYLDSFGDYLSSSKPISNFLAQCDETVTIYKLTIKYQFNNDCAIQVYEAAKILLKFSEEKFNSAWLWEQVKNLELNKEETATDKRLAFAIAVKQDPYFLNIYNEIHININPSFAREQSPKIPKKAARNIFMFLDKNTRKNISTVSKQKNAISQAEFYLNLEKHLHSLDDQESTNEKISANEASTEKASASTGTLSMDLLSSLPTAERSTLTQEYIAQLRGQSPTADIYAYSSEEEQEEDDFKSLHSR